MAIKNVWFLTNLSVDIGQFTAFFGKQKGSADASGVPAC